jgi:hypothetical protein
VFYGDDTCYRDVWNINVCLDVDSFLSSSLGPFSLHPFLACQGHTPCLFDPKKERGKTYFKADLFYAFVYKANLFSKCAMSEWDWSVV